MNDTMGTRDLNITNGVGDVDGMVLLITLDTHDHIRHELRGHGHRAHAHAHSHSHHSRRINRHCGHLA